MKNTYIYLEVSEAAYHYIMIMIIPSSQAV